MVNCILQNQCMSSSDYCVNTIINHNYTVCEFAMQHWTSRRLVHKEWGGVFLIKINDFQEISIQEPALLWPLWLRKAGLWWFNKGMLLKLVSGNNCSFCYDDYMYNVEVYLSLWEHFCFTCWAGSVWGVGVWVCILFVHFKVPYGFSCFK